MADDYSGLVQGSYAAGPVETMRLDTRKPLLKRGKKKESTPKEDVKSDITFADPDSYKHGGVVRKTGYAKVHKNERVLTAKQAKRYRKSRSK